MAYSILAKPNVLPVSTTYPFGDIRDRIGTTPGTPGSRLVYADFHQFFAKLMDEAGVTPNDLPDNNVNGYQLISALKGYISNQFLSFYYTNFTDFFDELTNISGFIYAYEAKTRGLTEVNAANNNTTIDFVSLGKTIPTGSEHHLKFDQNPTGSFNFRIIINSTNAGANPPIIKQGVTASDSVYTIPINKSIKFLRTALGWEILD